MYADDADEEQLDDDFFEELDAAEAAAARFCREQARGLSEISDNKSTPRTGDVLHKKSAAKNVLAPYVPRTPTPHKPSSASAPAAAAAPKSPPGDACYQYRRTSLPGSCTPTDVDRASQGCAAVTAAGSRPTRGIVEPIEYEWEVKAISVRDASTATEEDVGKGTLTVRCRQEPDGALVLLNAVVMAAGGGSAMDIPREAITRLSGGQTEQSSPRNSPALDSPAVLLHLGIGCTLVLSGLLRRGQERSADFNSARKLPTTDAVAAGHDTAPAVAVVETAALAKAGGEGAVGATPPLPAATPERRQLAPTEFLTPSFVFANQGSGGSLKVGEVIDGSGGAVIAREGGRTVSGGKEVVDRVEPVVLSPPARGPLPHPPVNFDLVLAKLISDSSSSSTATTNATTPAMDVSRAPSAATQGLDLGSQPAFVGTAGISRGGLASGLGALNDQPKPAGNEKDQEALFPPERVVALASITGSPPVKAEEVGLVSDGRNGGGGGKSGSGSRGGGGSSGNADCKPVIAVQGEVDVPDGEWRRPLVASPANRRRTSAGRRRPNVRDGSTKKCVVLSLHDPGDRGDNEDWRKEQGGGGTADRSPAGEGPSNRWRSRKRPLEGLGERLNGWPEGSKVSSSSPQSQQQPSPPPPQRRTGGKVKNSWLNLRKALHERYRDFQENGAAEQAALESDRGSRSKGSGWGGEVLLPGLRVFRRQEQAFTYVDALEARLAPDDAARYKVLSFETSSTGSRKFLVCDIRRFEDHYPYTAAPSKCIFSQAQTRRPCPRSLPQPPAARPLRAEHGSDQTDAWRTSVRYSPGAQCSPAGSGLGSQGGPVADQGSRLPLGVMRPASRPSPLWHVYEIIREGSPCRMYFDLEFTRACNPGLDGEALVRAWINVVAGKLHQDFRISVGGSNFLDLDSSTPKKFSRHVILHLPGGQLFRDNSHVGRFVNSLAADLECWRPSSTLSPSTPTSNDGGERGGDATATLAAATPALSSTDGDAFPRDNASRSATTPMATADDTGASASATIAGCAVGHCVAPVAAHRSGFLGGSLLSGAGSEREIAEDKTTQRCRASDAAHATEGVDAGAIAGGTAGGGGGGGALESLWVNDGSGRTVLFADVSVYTRNRCFRLVGSSKYGKSAALKVAVTNKRTLEHMERRGARPSMSRDSGGAARTVLHDSFVVPAVRHSQEDLLTVEGEGQHRYSRYGRVHFSPQQHSTVSSYKDGSHSMAGGGGGGGGEGVGVDGGGRRKGQQGSVDGGGGGSGGGRWGVTGSGFGPSPFPAVDSFLRTLICQGGPRGDLRQWSYAAGEVSRDGVEGNGAARVAGERRVKSGSAAVTRKLTHQVANNRWCWNIGRAHKSNHVYLVTDLSSGEVCQRCHDQECRRSGYRSRPVRLPPEVAPSVEDLEAYELELGVAAAMRESPADWAAVS